MTTPLRWGLLSTARINRALIPPLRASKRNTLAAVASRSLAQAQAYAAERGIPRAFGSYEAMLADPDIDVVYISLPNALHAEWAIKVLEAGKHALVEKPIALTLAEVDAIAAAAKRTGKVASEAFMYRHHPQTLKVIEMARSGALGELRAMHGVFSYALRDPANVRLSPELGGGSIWDVGCYPISYARAVTGCEPEEVFGWALNSPQGIDLTFHGMLRFPGNVVATFQSSFALPFNVLIEVFGSQARLAVSNPYKPGKRERLLLTEDNETRALHVRGSELYIGEVEDMADAILTGQPPRVSLADSRGNTAAILALLESARSGKPVALEKAGNL